MFNTDMLALLICPVSHSTLHYYAERQCLISADGQHEYPIINGIPVLMPDNPPEE
ncbi:hypothetical protein KKI95_18530 [Xenorhabdus bovienii]|uniref:Trm112 family protein n=1 Tax=Xenorhabdus bovienii TaxID=40576 RepID=UPI0023B24D7E|nr:Trm112 family protein [Xenorhabdus bovienii]MDE9437866.1 hypothetical protein [Xenorhabdus bovienii]MDE9466903.1 hypothetical protein [Xenorhabdus bovienii]MDE9499650.1 hypothetical protein [Xenorhabdus bovienii]